MVVVVWWCGVGVKTQWQCPTLKNDKDNIDKNCRLGKWAWHKTVYKRVEKLR